MYRSARGLATLAIAAAVLVSVALAGVDTPSVEAGKDYRVRHFDLADLTCDELPWTNEPRLTFPVRRVRDARGVPMIRLGGRRFYRPGELAISGMKRLDAFIEEGEPRQLGQALKQARQLRRMALRRRGAWWIPFWYDYPPAAQRAPWVNAMSRGLALSFFIRLHHVTGEDVHMDAARKIFRSFARYDRPGRMWVSFIDDRGYLWLEHYPSRRPSHVLNAHLHAVFGVYEYWQATRSPMARRVLEGAITTMRDHASRYRVAGGNSFYDLVNRTRHGKYHRIHIWQLRLLGRISGDPYFWRLADRLAKDGPPRGYVPGRPAVRVKPPWTKTADVAAFGEPAAGSTLTPTGAPSPEATPLATATLPPAAPSASAAPASSTPTPAAEASTWCAPEAGEDG